MKTFKELSLLMGVSRPSVGRIVKRENITATSQYDKNTRKIIKIVSDDDASFLINKYRKDSK